MSEKQSDKDDPTRALDDFVRRMRPAAPAEDAPDLSDLVARLRPEHISDTPARPKGGRLRNGQTWDVNDVEDVPLVERLRPEARRSDVPELDLPTVDLHDEQLQAAQVPELDLPPVAAALPASDEDIAAAVWQARELAASQQRVEQAEQSAPIWQPDLTALQLRRAVDPRLLGAWQPGAWIGAVRQVFEGTTEFLNMPDGSPTVQTWPPHRLLLLWPPQGLGSALLGRWPQQLRLSALPQDQAADALLAELPPDAKLWLHGNALDIDWALAAEILLHHEAGLRPFQAEGLRAFIAAERDASYSRLNLAYQPAAGGGAELAER